MGQVTAGMGKVLESMNVEQISKVMDTFEKQFEDMDVRSEYIEGAMNSSTTAAMPEEQVDSLMQEVATVHNIKFSDNFKTVDGSLAAGPSSAGASAPTPMAAS